MNIVPFHHDHMRALEFQPEQEAETLFMTPEDMAAFDQGVAFSAIEDGVVFGVAGIMDIPGWNGQRAVAWAVLRPNVGVCRLLQMTRAARQALAEHPARRIECSVSPTFLNGMIWARRLGFVVEGLMRGYGPNGDDYLLYARVKR